MSNDQENRPSVAHATTILTNMLPQLEAVANYEDVKEVLDFSNTCAAYAKLKEKSGAARNLAAQAYLRAERKLGYILSSMPAQRGVSGVDGKMKVYEDLGINRMRASRAQRLAQVEDEEFGGYIDVCQDEGMEPTVTGALSYAEETSSIKQSVNAMQEFKNRATKDLGEVFKLGDGPDIANGKNGYMIMTESEGRGKNISKHVWKSARMGIILTLQQKVPDVVAFMRAVEIPLRWIISIETSSVKNDDAKITTSAWRPALIFQGEGWIERDVIRIRRSGRNSLRQLFEMLILSCTNENELVFDPFMRDSSCALAAVSTSRRFMGCPAERTKINGKAITKEVVDCLRSMEF